MTVNAEERLVRRAAYVVAAVTAGAVTLVVVVVVFMTWVIYGQQEEDWRVELVRVAAEQADGVDQVLPGVVLLQRTKGGRVDASPGTPPELRPLASEARPEGPATRTIAGQHWMLWTSKHKGGTTYTAATEPTQADSRPELIVPLLIAGFTGVLDAAVIGWLVGRLSARPLARALALQRQFVADAGHELRTPLAVLHTRAQLLARRHPSPELDALVRDTRALGEVVSDLLLSAELEHRPAAAEPVDLAEVATEAVERLRPLADERGVTLETRGGGGSPVVPGVRTALVRAVFALVDNAVAHCAPGGFVVVTTGVGRDGAVVEVADDGEGLSPVQAATASDRFRTGAETGSSTGRRFGLGLALVREVVEAHGGTFRLTGATGWGATATIRLPPVATGSSG